MKRWAEGEVKDGMQCSYNGSSAPTCRLEKQTGDKGWVFGERPGEVICPQHNDALDLERPTQLKDWVGKTVRLRRVIKGNGANGVFQIGCLMVVLKVDHGLELRTRNRMASGYYGYLGRVRTKYLEIA